MITRYRGATTNYGVARYVRYGSLTPVDAMRSPPIALSARAFVADGWGM